MRSASIQRFLCFALLCFLPSFAGLLHARCDYQGIIRPVGAGLCLEGETHAITNLCTGVTTYLRSSLYNLGAYSCQNVTIDGPGVATVTCQGCQITEVQFLQPVPPACVVQVRDLAVNTTGTGATWLQWSALPCVDNYDVIKGDLQGFTSSGSGVDLGRVSCLAKDHTGTSTFQGPLDTADPRRDEAFFYLVRSKGPNGVTPYGLSSWGAEETVSGGCHL